MRHKVLMSLQQLPEADKVCLGDVSEFDETFVLDCYKGKKLDSSISRKPRKHGAKAEKEAFPMNMCASVPEFCVKVMHLLPLSIGQNLVQKNSSAYSKDILQMEHLPFVTAYGAIMHFQGSQTALSNTNYYHSNKDIRRGGLIAI